MIIFTNHSFKNMTFKNLCQTAVYMCQKNVNTLKSNLKFCSANQITVKNIRVNMIEQKFNKSSKNHNFKYLRSNSRNTE